MAWIQTGSIRGPAGVQGPPGPGIHTGPNPPPPYSGQLWNDTQGVTPAVSVVGADSAAAAFLPGTALPAHQAGDLIVMAARRTSWDGDANLATVPQGWAKILGDPAVTGGGVNPTGNPVSLVTGYQVATSSSHTSGTWTNASAVAAVVLRGNGVLGIGAVAGNHGNQASSVLAFPGLPASAGVVRVMARNPSPSGAVLMDGASALLNITSQTAMPAGGAAALAVSAGGPAPEHGGHSYGSVGSGSANWKTQSIGVTVTLPSVLKQWDGTSWVPVRGLSYKGTVPGQAELPASGNTVGDTWTNRYTGHLWSWDGSAWQNLNSAYLPPPVQVQGFITSPVAVAANGSVANALTLSLPQPGDYRFTCEVIGQKNAGTGQPAMGMANSANVTWRGYWGYAMNNATGQLYGQSASTTGAPTSGQRGNTTMAVNDMFSMSLAGQVYAQAAGATLVVNLSGGANSAFTAHTIMLTAVKLLTT